ncbi:MAG: acyltransferase family protein [Caldilineales bacterium]|nr:acyltransferase family protein [Caldilineales bacterium]
MSDNGQEPLCAAITQSGERCSRHARPGMLYCGIHASLEDEGESVEAPTPTVNGQELGERDAVRQQVREALDNPEKVGSDTPRSGSPFSPQQLADVVKAGVQGMSPEMQERVLSRFDELIASEWLQLETWQGIGYVAQVAIQMQADFIKRRFTGEYEVDKWGYDAEVAEYLALITGLVYKHYWRVEMNGVEHIPNEGRAMLFANHSGVIPFDGAMIAYGVREYQAAHRLVRALTSDWLPSLPFLSTLLNKGGQVVAHPDNSRRLLEEEELILVFPEGGKGVRKNYRNRYRLGQFGSEGYVRQALQARAPILPVSVVGSEETYPVLADAKPLARAFGLSSFPITPTFPWLGLLGVFPLPTKWTIDVGEPIDTSAYDDEMIADPDFVAELTDLIRNKIQIQLDERLAQRKSVFRG